MNPETVVLAHYCLAGLSGFGLKSLDWCGSWACSSCHDAVDFRSRTNFSRDSIRLMHAEGVLRTIKELAKQREIMGDIA